MAMLRDPFHPDAARARKILRRVYGPGATSRPELHDEERGLCQRLGYLWPEAEPYVLLQTALPVITVDSLARGFILSLRHHLPELRSALGSYFALQHRSPSFAMGEINSEGALISLDVNYLSYTRVVHGGSAFHWNPHYASFDLWLFSQLWLPPPEPSDIECIQAIFHSIRTCDRAMTAARLAKQMKGLFPSNRAERFYLLDILAWSGILPIIGPAIPRDWPFADPAANWRGSDGVREERILEIFRQYV